jgi:hypothetical protein
MASKYTTEETLLMRGLAVSAEWGRLGLPARVLFPVVHLLHKLFRFLLVYKGQACKAVFELEGVEKGPVLIVSPGVEYFLVPDDAPIRRLLKLDSTPHQLHP